MSYPNIKTVYLIRHGESTNNVKRKDDNHLDIRVDSSLTKKGIKQAKNTGKKLKKSKSKIDKIYSSPYPRATQTAEAISKILKKDYEVLEFTHERSNDKHRSHFENIYNLNEEGGENFESIKDRARKTLEFLENSTNNNIALVSHGIFLRVLLAFIVLGEDLTQKQAESFMRKFMTKNSGITKLYRFEESWMLATWNDYDHVD